MKRSSGGEDEIESTLWIEQQMIAVMFRTLNKSQMGSVMAMILIK